MASSLKMSKSFAQRDFSKVLYLFRKLSKKEKRVFYISLFARLSLVILDLAGLSLVGVSVTLVSGTLISPSSITGKLIANLSSYGFTNLYAIFAFTSVVFFILKALLSVRMNNWVLVKVADLEAAKATELFTKLGYGDLDKLQKFTKVEVNKSLQEGFELSVSKLIGGISIIFGEAALIIGVSAFLVVTDALLFLFFALFFLLLGLTMQKAVSEKSRAASAEILRQSVSTYTTVFDFYENFRQIYALGKQSFFVHRFSQSRVLLARSGAKLASLGTLPRYITEIALMFGFAILILQRSVFGANSISAATISVFVAGSFRLITSLLPLQGTVAMLRQIIASTTKQFEMNTTYSGTRVSRPTSSDNFKDSRPDVIFENVTFVHENGTAKLLSDATFTFQHGRYYAIIGPSGVGKSTLADLVIGLRTPRSGKVTIGGVESSDFLAAHPGFISYVPQKCTLFTGTLGENIALENLDSPGKKERALFAATQAGLSSLIHELGGDLEFPVGEGARELSGGQVQRVGLARALYQDSKILILDEATSSLDEATENEILKTINSLRGTMTIISISHRPSSIRHADLIARLRGGSIHLEPNKEKVD